MWYLLFGTSIVIQLMCVSCYYNDLTNWLASTLQYMHPLVPMIIAVVAVPSASQQMLANLSVISLYRIPSSRLSFRT